MPKKSQSKQQRSGLADKVWGMASMGHSLANIAEHLNVSLEQVRTLRAEAGEQRRQQGLDVIRQRNAPNRQQITHEDFLKWLSIVLERLEQMPVWPLGLTAFTYLKSAAWWGLERGVIVEIIDSPCEAAYKSGDTDAIFRFAKENREALLKDWVGRELVNWRLCEDKKKFDKFMRAYWTTHGHRSHENTLSTIRLHQCIYRDSLDWTDGPKVRGLAAKHCQGQNTIKLVLKRYSAAYKHWSKSKLTHLHHSISALHRPA